MSSGLYVLLGAAIAFSGSIAAGILEQRRMRRFRFEEEAAAWLGAMDSFFLTVGSLPKSVGSPGDQATGSIRQHLNEFADKLDELLPGLAPIRARLWEPINQTVKADCSRLLLSTTRLLMFAPNPRRLADELKPAIELIEDAQTHIGDSAVLDRWMSEVRPGLTQPLLNRRRWWIPTIRRPIRRNGAYDEPPSDRTR